MESSATAAARRRTARGLGGPRPYRPAADAEALEARRFLTVFLVTNPSDAGGGSLRAAITAANNMPGGDVIRFDIADLGVPGPLSIAPLSPLPDITDVLTIDG